MDLIWGLNALMRLADLPANVLIELAAAWLKLPRSLSNHPDSAIMCAKRMGLMEAS